MPPGGSYKILKNWVETHASLDNQFMLPGDSSLEPIICTKKGMSDLEVLKAH